MFGGEMERMILAVGFGEGLLEVLFEPGDGSVLNERIGVLYNA
jgi:hypothetical protein